MRIFKPLQTSLLYKTFEWEKRQRLAVSVLIGFPFDGGEPLLEQQLWKFIPGELGKDAMLDMCMPKPNSEVLVYGSYHAPGRKPVTADRVRLKIGTIDKKLAIIGNRYWRTLLGPTAPEPFREMPLSYNQAFGGKDFKPNPTGKGLDEVDVFGEMRLPLPNIEDPNHLLTSTDHRPDPAGFGPLDMMWETRASKLGTYDERWQRECAPGYAEDLDWTHFNAAPPDQWLSGFFAGDEGFQILNMHPDKPKVGGQLPGFRARCFIEHGVSDQEHFDEIEMRAETAFLFPHKETGIMLYRGTINITEDDASDVAHMIIGYENLSEPPRTTEHYKTAMRNRIDPDKSLKYMMTTVDMIPEGARCGFARMLDEVQEPEGAMAKNMAAKADAIKKEAEEQLEEQREKLKADLTQIGIDPAPYLEKMKIDPNPEITDPHMKEMIEIADQIVPGFSSGSKEIDLQQIDMSKMDDLQKKGEEIAAIKKEEAKEKLREIITQYGDQPGSEEVKAKVEEALKKMDEPPTYPRPPGKEVIEQLRGQLLQAEISCQQMRQHGIPEAQLPRIDVDIDDVERNMEEAAEKMKETYRMGAHMMDKGGSPHALSLDVIKQRFLAALEKGKSLAKGDYACIDLSGLDLSGIDLSECYLEGVNFSGTTLNGANLSGAILAHADLSGADLRHANLEGANIGATKLKNANLSDANLKGAKLGRAEMDGAKLIRCNMEETEFLEAKPGKVDMSESILSTAIFLELDLKGARFQKTQMPRSNFIKCQLKGADFSEAVLDESNWVESNLDDTKFSGATMNNVRFPGGCSLKKVHFDGAKLDKSLFRDADLEDADFSNASLNMADFGSANLKRANFKRSIAKRAQFMKADLAAADMSFMNLMEGTLMKAGLTSTNLRGANLYGVEFMNATVGETDFSEANLDQTKLKDWRPKK